MTRWERLPRHARVGALVRLAGDLADMQARRREKLKNPARWPQLSLSDSARDIATAQAIFEALLAQSDKATLAALAEAQLPERAAKALRLLLCPGRPPRP